MAIVFSRELLNCGTYYVVVTYLIYAVHAEESKLIPHGSNEYYQLATGQRLLDKSETIQHVRLESEDGSPFFRILLPSSRTTKSKFTYQDNIPNFGGCSESYFRLPNATLMICFSVVLAYMVYIVTALVLNPVLVEDHTNPSVKVLLSDRTVSDSIVPPKLRGLYGELEFGSSDTLLGLQKTDIPAADECLNYKGEKSVAGELRVFSAAT